MRGHRLTTSSLSNMLYTMEDMLCTFDTCHFDRWSPNDERSSLNDVTLSIENMEDMMIYTYTFVNTCHFERSSPNDERSPLNDVTT